MDKVQMIAGAAILLLPVTAAHAQKPLLPLPPPLFVSPIPSAQRDIPTDQWVYIDLDRIQYHEQNRTAVYPTRTGSFRAYTRAEFARLVADKLRSLDDVLEQEIQTDPPLWRALCRLVQEFTPELKQQNVDVAAVLNRLRRGGNNLQTNRAD